MQISFLNFGDDIEISNTVPRMQWLVHALWMNVLIGALTVLFFFVYTYTSLLAVMLCCPDWWYCSQLLPYTSWCCLFRKLASSDALLPWTKGDVNWKMLLHIQNLCSSDLHLLVRLVNPFIFSAGLFKCFFMQDHMCTSISCIADPPIFLRYQLWDLQKLVQSCLNQAQQALFSFLPSFLLAAVNDISPSRGTKN